MSEGETPPQRGAGAGDAGRLDQLLAEWPTAGRSAAEWDDAAERVMSQLEGSAGLAAEEDLCRPALPAQPDEVAVSSVAEAGSEADPRSPRGESRERDRASLKDLAKDLAKMAATPAPLSARSGAIFGTPLPSPASPEPDAKQDNSGMIDLGALATAEAQSRKPSSELPVDATLRSAGLGLRSKRPLKSKRSLSGVVVAAIVAVAAVGAGVFFGVRRGPSRAVRVDTNAPPPTAATTIASAAQIPAATTPSLPLDEGVDPSTLPRAQVSANLPRGSTVVAPRAAATSAPPPPALLATAPAATAPAATVPATTSTDRSLQTLMQQAAGASPTVSNAPAPAAGSDVPVTVAPGSVPFKPSQGAIQGALGAALPGARACLGPDDPVSHATVTFQSDGSVRRVLVSGGAFGQPAERCIRAALMKARVSPFAQPTFTATTTVRAN